MFEIAKHIDKSKISKGRSHGWHLTPHWGRAYDLSWIMCSIQY